MAYSPEPPITPRTGFEPMDSSAAARGNVSTAWGLSVGAMGMRQGEPSVRPPDGSPG